MTVSLNYNSKQKISKVRISPNQGKPDGLHLMMNGDGPIGLQLRSRDISELDSRP